MLSTSCSPILGVLKHPNPRVMSLTEQGLLLSTAERNLHFLSGVPTLFVNLRRTDILRLDLPEPVVKDRVMLTRVWNLRHADWHVVTSWAGQHDPGLEGVVEKFPKNPRRQLLPWGKGPGTCAFSSASQPFCSHSG